MSHPRPLHPSPPALPPSRGCFFLGPPPLAVPPSRAQPCPEPRTKRRTKARWVRGTGSAGPFPRDAPCPRPPSHFNSVPPGWWQLHSEAKRGRVPLPSASPRPRGEPGSRGGWRGVGSPRGRSLARSGHGRAYFDLFRPCGASGRGSPGRRRRAEHGVPRPRGGGRTGGGLRLP